MFDLTWRRFVAQRSRVGRGEAVLPHPGEAAEVAGYARIRLLSLDVALGALGAGVMAARFLAQPMPWSWYVVLPVAVWVVYTWDHLLDAQRLGRGASTPRHRFHHAGFRPILATTVAGALVCIVLAVSTLGRTGVIFGIAMGSFAILHFFLVRVSTGRRSRWLFKELGVGLVYAVGIWGLPWIASGRLGDPIVWVVFGQFFLLAMTNLLEFSLFERTIDEADGHASWARAWGERATLAAISVALVAFLLLGLVGMSSFGPTRLLRIELTYLPIAGILTALLLCRRWFRERERYRAWGDGAFLVPWVHPWIPWG